jgi:hypothetical protein
MVSGMIANTNRRLGVGCGAVALVGVVLVLLVGAVPAVAASPWWFVQSSSSPSFLPQGGEGEIHVTVENVGDAPIYGESTPVTITDRLPAGFEVKKVAYLAGQNQGGPGSGTRGNGVCSPVTVSCTWMGEEKPLDPFQMIEMTIVVRVVGGVSGESMVSVSGGGAPEVDVERPVDVGAETPFGVNSYALAPEEEGGALDTRAGSHPFQLTNAFALNENPRSEPLVPPALVRNLAFALPAGLVGNATVTPRCTTAQFVTIVGESDENLCPQDTAVGVASVSIVANRGVGNPIEVVEEVPLFNLVSEGGEPARFGFEVEKVAVSLDASVRTGGDYGVTVSSTNTAQVAVVRSVRVTFWGAPGDPRHNESRGWGCLNGGHLTINEPERFQCTPSEAAPPPALLTLPTSCTGPLQSTVSVTSWPTREDPNGLTPAPFALSEPGVSLTGCERLRFDPSLSVTPEANVGGSPTGLGVDIHVPSIEQPEALAEGTLRDAVVTLPAGMVINPSGASGLGACSEGEIGLDNANPVSCPESSKVGTAEAVSPDVHNPLVGSVYVAEQSHNPFGSLIALYLVVEGEGVLIKSAGEVHLDPTTGQVTTTFKNLPQLPSTDIRLHMFGGAHGALSTPVGCGTYTTNSRLTPYNTTTPAEPSSAFQITSGPNGTGCAGQGFAPSFSAGTTNNQAGGFSPFSVTFSRQDQDQGLGGVSVTTPPGLLALLRGVERCPEPQASAGTCGAGSLIGHATATAGAGPDPVSVTGQVFLTGPYKGAPFGLSIVVPAAVGPFNLGNVVTRAAISVDPHTARITVTSDPLPTILQGIPLQIRTVNVTVDRQGFIFNPTNCEPLSVGGVLSSTQGASANVSAHFQAANCANLPFKPTFTVSTQAATSKSQGASLLVKGTFPAGGANLHGVAVTLPKQLPARLTTIQQACTAAVFAANPAACPTGSNIGTATASTPVLAGPVSGPVYLVSHGGAAFPDVVMILQGEGVTLDVVGSIDIRHGVTSSTFASIPDAPITSFALDLPEGPHSGLAAVVPAKAKGSLCGQSLSMPFTITAQNGAVVKQNTKIAVTGCPTANTRRAHGKKGKAKKHTKGRKK